MKNRRLAVVPCILCLTSLSGAQTPAPGTATQPGVAPAPGVVATPAVPEAPWRRVDESKRQYYVFKSFAPPEVAAQLDRPVADPAYRALLAKRAAAFRSGAKSLRLVINPNSIVDVGTDGPEDANTVAFVELEKSPDLLQTVRTELKVDTQKNYVLPFLNSMYARDPSAEGYRVHDQIIVNVAAMDLSQVSVWRLSDGKWQREYQGVAGAQQPAQDKQALLNKLQSVRIATHRGGYARVARAVPTLQAAALRAATMEELQAVNRVQAATASKTSPAPGGEPQPQPQPQPPPPPPPQTYTAYGKVAPCDRHCSYGGCIGCCAGVIAAEKSSIFALSLTCHLLSDLCPWCHAGCAANTAVLSAIAATHQTTCVVGCTVPYEVPATQRNPKRCPLH